MINKITNWTIGSIFRTIGRFIAYAIIGLLIYLFASGKVSASSINHFSIENKYITRSNINSCLSSSSCRENGNITSYITSNSGNITFIDDPINLKEYYLIFNNGGSSYKVYTHDSKFYSIISYEGGFHDYILRTYTYKLEIDESLYNQKYNNGERKVIFHDTSNNKYYYFTNELLGLTEYTDRYFIDSSSMTSSSSSDFIDFDRLYFQNTNEVYYYGSSQDTTHILKVPNTLNDTIVTYNVNFKLNGGTMFVRSNSGFLPYVSIDDTYSVEVRSSEELYDLLLDLSPRKDGVNFHGWYSDKTLTIPYIFGSDPVWDNMNLYANWIYNSPESVISNTTFIEYTFPNDKQYAVINVVRRFGSGLLFGFGSDFQNITAYRWNGNSSLGFDTTLPLNSFANYNGKYYYFLNPEEFNPTDTFHGTYLVLIDKKYLSQLNSMGELVNYYTFWVSDNAEVTFINDLTEVTFKDMEGNTLTENIYPIYEENSRIIIQNSSDIWTILKNSLSVSNHGSLYSLFNTLWSKFNGSYLSNYLYFLMIGSIILFFLRVASRK